MTEPDEAPLNEASPGPWHHVNPGMVSLKTRTIYGTVPTEPDEPRIAWNACAAARYDDEENGNPLGLPQGMPNFEDFRDGYRAGAAASAERIKELEARVAELKAALKPLSECEIPEESDSLPDGYGCRYYVTFGEIRTARALLKDPDQ